MKRLGCEQLRFIRTLTENEQGKSRTSSGIFGMLNKKFKPEHNE